MTMLRLFGSWVLIAIAMIANGMLRELAIRPGLGTPAADIISPILGIGIILVMTRYLLGGLAGQPVPQLVRAAATLVVLTVTFEFLFGYYVEHLSWAQMLDSYAIWRGRLWPVVLATLAFTPFLWGRWALDRRRHTQSRSRMPHMRTEKE